MNLNKFKKIIAASAITTSVLLPGLRNDNPTNLYGEINKNIEYAQNMGVNDGRDKKLDKPKIKKITILEEKVLSKNEDFYDEDKQNEEDRKIIENYINKRIKNFSINTTFGYNFKESLGGAKYQESYNYFYSGEKPRSCNPARDGL